MSDTRSFVINYGALASGEHEFEYEINETFFQRFENSLIQKGDVDVLLVIDKKDNMLLLDFTMEGTITVQCDRCLEDLDLDIEGYNELIVKFGNENKELSENIVMMSSKEHEIDVAQYIYEYLTLMIPMRNVHEDENGESTCDPEVIRELEKHKIPDASSDPRWDALKKINLN
jgi:uncharacterized protein